MQLKRRGSSYEANTGNGTDLVDPYRVACEVQTSSIIPALEMRIAGQQQQQNIQGGC